MKRKVLSLFVAVCLIFGMLPTAAFAADQTSSDAGIRVQYVEDSYNEETGVFLVNVQAKLPSGTGISSLGAILSFDNTKLTLINRNNGNELLGSEGNMQSPKAAAINVLLTDDDEFGSTISYTMANGDLYKSGNRSALYAYIYTSDATTGAMNTGNWFDCFQVTFKAVGDLDIDSLRIADAAKDNDVIKGVFPANDIYSVYVTDNSNPAKIYCFNKMADNNSGEATGDKYLMAATGTGDVTYPSSTTPPGEDDGSGTTTTSDYEIWYELDSTATDTLTPNFKDYQYNTTEGTTNQVKAEIFLKSTKADVTVQAYDIYLSHNTKLTYSGENTMAGAVYKTVDADNKIAAAKGDQVSHIQLVKDSGKTINLTAGEAESLGAITFDIASSAIYDEDLEITLKVAADTENAAKTADVTNISLATTTGGQVASFYPMNTGTDLGAEVVTTYTVTYDADNGTQATIQTVGRNQTAIKPADPEKAGYEFAGWYNGETEFDFSTLITKNIELIAKWDVATANYTVEHWQQNVEGTDYVKVEADTETKDGQTGAQTAAEAKDYSGFTAQTFTQSTIVADGSTIVKIYYNRNSYTITVNKDNGSEAETITGRYGSDVTKPSDPTKTGYDFAGWDVNGDNQYDTTDTFPTTMPVDDLTVKAIWTPVTYTVAYNGNGNTGGSMTASTFTYDAENQKLTPNTFTKTGYTFNGWNTKADGTGTPYTNEAEVENWASEQDSTINLFVQWKANTYTVTFNAHGGSGDTMESQNFEYDKAQTLKKNTYTNEGYSFAGWSYGGKTYSDEASVLNLTDVNGASVEMLAQWTKQNTIKVIADSTKGSATTTPISAIPEQTVTVNITPNPGYEVDTVTYVKEGFEVTSDATKINDTTYTFSMPDGNAEVTVTFTAIPYDVTVTNPTDGTGTITATGTTDGKATVGQVITLSNDPKPGYELDKYIVNGTTVDGNTFTMPASDVAVTATFKVIEYTITYDLAGGALAEGTVNPTTYDVTTDTFTLNNPSRQGYTFAGWTGSNGTTPETTVTIEKGSFGEKTYTANWTGAEVEYTVNHWQQNIGAEADDYTNGYTTMDTETLRGTTDSKVTPERKSYEGFTAPEGQEVTIAANGSTVVNYYYTRNSYTIIATANNASYGTVTAPAIAEYGSTVTLTNTPNNGYKFVNYSATYKVAQDGQEVNQPVNVAEDGTFTMPAGNVTVTANFDVITYKITLDPNGGTVDPTEVSYNIKDGGTLPTPSNGLFTFQGWKVTTAAGNWEIQENVLIAAGAFSNRYGGEENAVLTAQWTFMEHDIEDYKYAYNPDANNLTDGYKLLRVKDNFGEQTGMEYKFGEESMYYTTDTNYLIDSTKDSGVFFLLIEEKYVGTDNRLNAIGEALLSSGTATSGRATLIAAGENKWDINGDSVVNIADANVVYQMTLSGGSYYSDGENGGQLDNKHRLMADLVTARNDQGNDHRASIKDVNAIVNQINGVVETTNP